MLEVKSGNERVAEPAVASTEPAEALTVVAAATTATAIAIAQ